jgi:iron complex outermembrane receptor protein
LRLLSPGDGPFRYTLGLFYGDNDLRRSFKRGPVFSLAQWYAMATSENKAAFGQGRMDLPAQDHGDRRPALPEGRHRLLFQRHPERQRQVLGRRRRTSSATYRLGLRHQVTDDVMLFGSYATGHKGQTYDLTTGFNQARANVGPINPGNLQVARGGDQEPVVSITASMLNGTIFHVKYDDYQAQGIDTIGGTQNFRLTNVGKVLTKGVEARGQRRSPPGTCGSTPRSPMSTPRSPRSPRRPAGRARPRPRAASPARRPSRT